MSKIGNTTVRGGWSKTFWSCTVNGKHVGLFAETGSDIPQAKMRWWKKHIEEKGITPVAPFTMFKITKDGQLTGAK